MERRDLEAQSFCCYKMKECQVVATFQYYNKKKKKYERKAFWILRISRFCKKRVSLKVNSEDKQEAGGYRGLLLGFSFHKSETQVICDTIVHSLKDVE